MNMYVSGWRLSTGSSIHNSWIYGRMKIIRKLGNENGVVQICCNFVITAPLLSLLVLLSNELRIRLQMVLSSKSCIYVSDQ